MPVASMPTLLTLHNFESCCCPRSTCLEPFIVITDHVTFFRDTAGLVALGGPGSTMLLSGPLQQCSSVCVSTADHSKCARVAALCPDDSAGVGRSCATTCAMEDMTCTRYRAVRHVFLTSSVIEMAVIRCRCGLGRTEQLRSHRHAGCAEAALQVSVLLLLLLLLPLLLKTVLFSADRTITLYSQSF